MNRTQNADHAARTYESFVYSTVKITRLYDYKTGFDLNFLFHWPAGPVISAHWWSTEDFIDPKLLDEDL